MRGDAKDVLKVVNPDDPKKQKKDLSIKQPKPKPIAAPPPDPLWPKGVEPGFLTDEQKQTKAQVPALVEGTLIDGYTGGLEVWTCQKCGTHTDKSIVDYRYCNKCYAEQVSNSAVAKKTNSDWMEQSKACGLEIYERQPEETDIEWHIWNTYRSYYPGRLPNWSELAKKCECSNATVAKTAGKWSFNVRIQAWARRTDSEVQESRIIAIKEMNDRQQSMAQRLLEKISAAIDTIDPVTLKPGEISNMFKMASELERRITLGKEQEERIEQSGGAAESMQDKQQKLIKTDDLNEVVGILQKAGFLQGSKVGVEQKTTTTTTTTRVLADKSGSDTDEEDYN